MRLPYLAGCGQLWLLSSEITGLFHYLYLWKESVHALDLLHEDNHQGRADLKVPLLVGCGHLCLSFNQIVGFFDH